MGSLSFCYRKEDYLLAKFSQEITEGILFTDQYQLVMAQLYFETGIHEKVVQFDHFFRNYPNYGLHKAGYCINAGLEWLVEWMQDSNFGPKEIDYLKSHKSPSGKRLYSDSFLNWLKENGNFFSISMLAIPEGRVVHANEAITVIKGPLAMSQILETALLNQLNYQTLIATKASRIKEIGRGRPVLEFGARRAQDRAAIAGVRGALIGGADYSSNAGISYLLGYTPKGTHSHSMIQIFISLGMTELEAFQAFADLYPEDCVLLVDTINTLESGIPNAIKVFEKLRSKGYTPSGIRLDSGDLAYLSIQASKMLDKSGFDSTSIVLSNELDEMNIWQIITQIIEEAPKVGVDANKVINRLVYGVGTRLITSYGDSALGGVYKLVAVKNEDKWIPVIKISETIEKIPNPGTKELYRVYDNSGIAIADYITLAGEDPNKKEIIHLLHPQDQSKRRTLKTRDLKFEPLLQSIIEEGKVVYKWPSIEEIRSIRETDLKKLDTGVKRLINPHIYHVSISEDLWNEKQEVLKRTLEAS